MSLDLLGILDGVASHALALGLFERFGTHEPKNAPGTGITGAAWIDRIEPAAGQSGLNSTSVRLTINVRVYTSMLAEPQDAIDPNIMAAVDALMAAYSGDFDLGGTVREVDLLGETGVPLSAQAGYLNQDGKLYRVFTLTVPVIVSDLWSQSQ